MSTQAVCGQCWLTLDREWVIASCGDGAPGSISQAVGMKVWDAFPGSEELFRGIYEVAWEHGRSAGVVYWNEQIVDLHCFRRGGELFVDFVYLTVAGLKATLSQLSPEALRGSAGSPRARPTHLHLVETG